MAQVKLIIDNEITLIEETSGTMQSGVYVEGVPVETPIPCSVQPQSRSLTKAEYGFFVEAEYQVFCYPNPAIKEGMKVIYNDTEYEILKKVDWDAYYILYLKAVGL